mgnify:CR=1 FL=1
MVKDIEVISCEHHSVAHPQERADVRDYLVSRLTQLGADHRRGKPYPLVRMLLRDETEPKTTDSSDDGFLR